MTAIMRSRRQADAFAALVDPARSVPARIGPSMPTAGRDTTRLLAVVDTLRTRSGSPEPSPDFAAELRDLLVSEAATALLSPVPQDVPAPPPVPGADTPRSRPGLRRRRLAVVATTAVVLVGSSTGVAAASQGALPGEALYPVKRGIERVEVGMAGSTADRGRTLLSQASNRLHEVSGLMHARNRQSALLVPPTLADFADEAHAGSDALMRSYASTGDPRSVKAIRDFAATNNAMLLGLTSSTHDSPAPGAPQALTKDLDNAASALQVIDADAIVACVTCSGRPPLPASEPALSSAPIATPTPMPTFVAGVVPSLTPSPLDLPVAGDQASDGVPDLAAVGATGTGSTTVEGSTSSDESSPPVVHTLPGLLPTGSPTSPSSSPSDPSDSPSDPSSSPSDPSDSPSDPSDSPSDPSESPSDPTAAPSQTPGPSPSDQQSGLPTSDPTGAASPTPSGSSTDNSSDPTSASPSDATDSPLGRRGPIIQ